MGKSKRVGRHHMEDTMETYRKIRKPMPRPTKVIDVEDFTEKWDWKQAIKKDLGDLE